MIKRLLKIIGAVVVLCVVATIIGAIANRGSPTSTPVSLVKPVVTIIAVSTATKVPVKPSATIPPTVAPAPTDTPAPTVAPLPTDAPVVATAVPVVAIEPAPTLALVATKIVLPMDRKPNYIWNYGPGTAAGQACSCGGPDLNCSSFASWDQAETCYLSCGGRGHDVFGLDRDKDGIICEVPKS